MKEETPEPTASMTDAPTMGATEEGTGMPTMAEGEGSPPSAAGAIVTGFATVGAVVAPLLLL